jgi:hypothetical protein
MAAIGEGPPPFDWFETDATMDVGRHLGRVDDVAYKDQDRMRSSMISIQC